MVPREERGGKAREEGWNREAAGQLRGKEEKGRRTTTAQGRTTAEMEYGRNSQEYLVSSDGDRGERRERDVLEESDNASEE